MTTSKEVNAFNWGEISLSQVVYINGAPHPTRAAIGEWLEYADPQKAIDNILTRNPYIESHSIPLSLRGMDGARDYETKAYHPIGFLLIVMESGQPKAQAMKQAVAEFVWHFAGPQRLSLMERVGLLKLSCAVAAQLSKTTDVFVREVLIAHLREIHLALGQPLPDIANLGTHADGKPAGQLKLSGV